MRYIILLKSSKGKQNGKKEVLSLLCPAREKNYEITIFLSPISEGEEKWKFNCLT
jgi:hypothetical protein